MESTPKESENYICNICNKKYSSLRYLRRHTMNLHISKRNHICPMCGKNFSSRNSMLCHLEIHKNKNERKYRYKCSVCSRGFNGKANLEDHMNKHTGDKPHSCPQCGKKFGFRSMLSKHNQFVHSDLRPHVCSVCAKSFKSKYILLSHMVSHTGISKYNCTHCMRPFSTCSSLHRHVPRCSVGKMKEGSVDVKTEVSSEENNKEVLDNQVEKVSLCNSNQAFVSSGCYTINMFGAGSKVEPSEMMDLPEEMLEELNTDRTSLPIEKVYVCSECIATFDTLDETKKHIAAYHNLNVLENI